MKIINVINNTKVHIRNAFATFIETVWFFMIAFTIVALYNGLRYTRVRNAIKKLRNTTHMPRRKCWKRVVELSIPVRMTIIKAHTIVMEPIHFMFLLSAEVIWMGTETVS